MKLQLHKVGILGSGLMGTGIAYHLANAGIPSIVLDILPESLTPQDLAAGLTLQDQKVRNRISRGNIENAIKQKPSPAFDPSLSALIETGNIEDDFDRLKGVDWILEAVPEKLAIKREIYSRLETIIQPEQMVSSNTSGISIHEMMAGRSQQLRRQFLVTHFFNPPRYMKLLELIPGPETDPQILKKAEWIGTKVFGKGIVWGKDTPNFIGNRIGIAEMAKVLHLTRQYGFSVEEVDTLTGKVIGRPTSGTFRLIDIVGLDTLVNNSRYLASVLKDDPALEVLSLPSFVDEMMNQKLLGEKTQAGFYKKVLIDKEREIHSLDLDLLQYSPQKKVTFPSLEMAKGIEDTAQRLRFMVNAPDPAGHFVWEVLSSTITYAALKIPEITDSIVQIDRAMRWGFNWELGPFEIWDALGIREVVTRLEKEGRPIPPLVSELLSSDAQTFYSIKNHTPHFFFSGEKDFIPIPKREGVLELPIIKLNHKKVLLNTDVASFVDLDDGVGIIEFHSKMNTISDETLNLINRALDCAEQNFEAVLIGNQGAHFSAGANLMRLLMAAENGEWDEIDQMIACFQATSMRLKYAPIPVVGCPHGMTLGGGCELNLHCSRIHAAAETYMGLVELGVGLIPAGAGTKEMAIRFQELIPPDAEVNRLPFLQRVFEMIGTAKVSGSAYEAQKMGLLRDHDTWSMNKDCQLHDAKTLALGMAAIGFRPRHPQPVRVMGITGLSTLRVALHNMLVAGYISEYDHYLGDRLAYVLCGGEIPEGTMVNEQYLLDLEREVFLHLCGLPKTQDRIRHTLKTGKPLRN